uniref:Tudor domain containing 6 n=1 Tax=Bos mutus grunniens TaxID=30521 RepID=A0A8B9YMI1_BOSMU
MCSTPGLPTPGASLVLRVSFVDVQPEVIPVQLWGLLGERRDEYVRLSREIQEAAAAARGPWMLGGASALPGELCLVQVGRLWHRGRVVSRQAQESRVFLLDEGCTIAAGAGSLAPGRSEFFHLPSEVLGCVLAGLVPAGGGGAGGGEPQHWAPRAVDFLSHLQGKEVHGRVLDVLLLHRLVLLEVPELSQQMQELGLARQVPDSVFRSLLKRYLSASTPVVVPRVPPKQEQPGLDYFYPQLQLGVTEPMVVTQVCHPHRIHCQLRSLSQEIHRLSESMAQVYRGSPGTGDEHSTSAPWEEREESPDKPGSPCASCGLDGLWYRALLLETFRPQRCAQVLHVDYGRKELVSCSSLRYLLPEYFRMPVVTYPCALYGLWDGGRGWSRSQVGDLKALILGQAVNAKIEFYCSFEHVYYVTLYGEDGINLNCVFGVQSCCLADQFLQSQGREEEEEEEEPETAFQCQSSAEEMDEEISLPTLPSIKLKMNTFYDAQVEFVKNPSEFWIRLRKHNGTFSKLMKKMCSFYASAKVVTDTTVTTNVSAGLVQDNEKRVSVYSPLVQNFLGIEPGSSCKGELQVGTTVEVRVSCVENPGYFWCQLTRNTQRFKALMCSIQDYCNNTAPPHQGTTPACLAKRTADGKWSRALITGAQSSEYVNIIFVDYGDKEMVSVKNIYSITEEFLMAKVQAFRCSLYNLIQPMGQNPFLWDEKAIQAFIEFIDNAQENSLELKCTIFALASIHDELFNVVDLLTPFQSVCHFLIQKRLARPVKFQKPLEFSVKLHSYFYSTHDMKIGSEESVYITHVDDPWAFYCQLGRNASILEQLSHHITQLSQVLLHLRTSPWSPAHWVIIEKEPNKVFFVDFGNICVVTSDDLCPVPSDAHDVLLWPMQAIKCSLSDIPDHIPEEVTAWFRETVLDKSLKALVVAKDPDGRLIIELYNDSIQINANINEKLGLRGYKGGTRRKKSKALLSTTETLEVKKEDVKLSPTEYLSKSENKPDGMALLGESYKPKISSACRELKFLQSSTKTNLVTLHQDSVGNKNNQVSPLTTDKKLESSAEKLRDSCDKGLPLKISEFPKKAIMPGFKTTVYVSHINDLSDFYVQLTEDEAEIDHLSERLNDTRTRPEYYAGPPLQRGDVICAVFPEDNLWYRAVVKEPQLNDLLSVQFIDYGNVSVVHTNKIGKLDRVNVLLPGLCIPCSLKGCGVPGILNHKEVMHYFSQRTNETQIRCEFVQFQDKWEVTLADEHGIIAEDMVSRYTFSEKSQLGFSTQIVQGACSTLVSKTDVDTSMFLNWYNPKMKTIRAYATVIDGPEYFWCQFADTKKLQHLEVEVQTVGEQVTDWRSRIHCPRIGDPCIVRYREDGHYYRALVTSICEDYLVSIRLVDFGNIVDSVDPKALWNIPSELLAVPMQAFPCCLSGFNISQGACPREGCDYFYEIVTEDVLEITILDIKRDVCDIPLAIVDLKSKGESISEKMKKYSKIDMRSSDLRYEKNDAEVKGALGVPSPDVGLKKSSSKTGRERILHVESQTAELLQRLNKDLNILETQPGKFYDPKTDNIFEAFENPGKNKIGTELLEEKVKGLLGDKTKFDDKYPMPGFNTFLPHATEAKEVLELNSLEVPLSPDDESKEFLELESIELQHSLVGDEEKEDLDLVPPTMTLPQGCDPEVTLPPLPGQLPLNCEDEKQPELELPTAQLCLEDRINPLSLTASQKAQEALCTEDMRGSSCAESFDEERRLRLRRQTCDAKMQIEMSIFKEEFTECTSRDAMPPLTSLFSEEEYKDARKHNYTLPDHIPENTYTLKGFTVGSKCVVWSSLRNTWSKCEILEIAEEGTKVLDLSNGIEEVVNPENVWNGIPKLDKSPSEGGRLSKGSPTVSRQELL